MLDRLGQGVVAESGARADRTREAAGPGSFCTVRREHVQVHRRAESGDVDVLLNDSREDELIAVGTGEIQADPGRRA